MRGEGVASIIGQPLNGAEGSGIVDLPPIPIVIYLLLDRHLSDTNCSVPLKPKVAALFTAHELKISHK